MTKTYSTPIIKHILRKLKYELKHPLYWSKAELPNWGDDLNPWLYEHLTGRKPIYCPHKSCSRLLMVGSILSSAGGNDICWGTGILSDGYTDLKLKRAFAARGPLTREVLLKNGIECPKVYGDPALLISLFMNAVKVDKKYKVSVIPHYVDRADGLVFAEQNNYNVIDVSLPIDDYINEVISSEVIISSSLHGLICADAFNTPSVWVKFSDKLIGGDFKFKDYYQGTQRKLPHCVDLRKSEKIDISRVHMDFPLEEIQRNLLITFPSDQFIVPSLKPEYR